jgi:hypothetical protein
MSCRCSRPRLRQTQGRVPSVACSRLGAPHEEDARRKPPHFDAYTKALQVIRAASIKPLVPLHTHSAAILGRGRRAIILCGRCCHSSADIRATQHKTIGDAFFRRAPVTDGQCHDDASQPCQPVRVSSDATDARRARSCATTSGVSSGSDSTWLRAAKTALRASTDAWPNSRNRAVNWACCWATVSSGTTCTM